MLFPQKILVQIWTWATLFLQKSRLFSLTTSSICSRYLICGPPRYHALHRLVGHQVMFFYSITNKRLWHRLDALSTSKMVQNWTWATLVLFYKSLDFFPLLLHPSVHVISLVAHHAIMPFTRWWCIRKFLYSVQTFASTTSLLSQPRFKIEPWTAWLGRQVMVPLSNRNSFAFFID